MAEGDKNKMMKQIADAAKEPPLTPAALRAWRQGYRAYLESKGLPVGADRKLSLPTQI
jgi:hypothetical protein